MTINDRAYAVKKAPEPELGAIVSSALTTPGRRKPSLVMIVVMIVAIMVTVAVPVAIGMPTPLLAIPPSVVLVPAAFPLRVQFSSLFGGLVAALAVFADRLIQFRFRALNLALAFGMVVRIRIRLRHGNQHRRTQSRRHNRRYRKSLKISQFQAALLSEFGANYFD